MTGITIAMPPDAGARIRHGAGLLTAALERAGLAVKQGGPWTPENYRQTEGFKLVVGNRKEHELIRRLEESDVLLYHTEPPEGEGFYLAELPGSLFVVSGGSDSGVLYGCLELAELVKAHGGLPRDLAFGDAPAMKLRGPVVPLQLTKVEPPRRTYEYPITPGRFPWFYDRGQWIDYLDRLLEYRCNVVYVWSGHPFSSLVRLPEYPEALEVTEEEFALNAATFRWLAEECDRRGIWFVLKFYNIHIPLPFAQKHGLDLHQPKPLPLTSDYYIRSISAFMRSFPGVGLMVCLGEALQGAVYGVEWFNETILAGVNEALADLKPKELPPIIVRAHAIPAEKVMAAALPNYPNLFTEAKYNGESLTTYTPRGKWQDTHRHLAGLGSIHLFNVHILANLEPFRYGSPSFIHKCVQAAKYRLQCNGIHLYPLFYWDWPYAPDKTSPRLMQIDRDWIWFAAWFRYAWNPDRDPRQERIYWAERLAERYGGSLEAGRRLLDAYEAAGEIAPKLLRRFGITEGNRQTMSLGMTMSQLTNPDRYRPWRELWECQAPEGERLDVYARREAAGEPHIGETPPDIADDAERHAAAAERAISEAAPQVTGGGEEFARLASDVRAIALMTRAYTGKVRAAMKVLAYKHASAGGDYREHAALLAEAEPELRGSLEAYRELASLTAGTYLYANSMQTPQRKVPFPDGGRYGHWTDCLPEYEAEYGAFVRHTRELQGGRLPEAVASAGAVPERYREAAFTLLSPDAETYTVGKDAQLFTDGGVPASAVAEELSGLTGIRFNRERASKEGFKAELELKEPARVLIGYFRSGDPQWLQVPDLEVNTHADDRGGASPVITGGMKAFFQPDVNIHAFLYEAGRHTIDLGPGAYLIVGVIRADERLVVRDADSSAGISALDWLYE